MTYFLTSNKTVATPQRMRWRLTSRPLLVGVRGTPLHHCWDLWNAAWAAHVATRLKVWATSGKEKNKHYMGWWEAETNWNNMCPKVSTCFNQTQAVLHPRSISRSSMIKAKHIKNSIMKMVAATTSTLPRMIVSSWKVSQHTPEFDRICGRLLLVLAVFQQHQQSPIWIQVPPPAIRCHGWYEWTTSIWFHLYFLIFSQTLPQTIR